MPQVRYTCSMRNLIKQGMNFINFFVNCISVLAVSYVHVTDLWYV